MIGGRRRNIAYRDVSVLCIVKENEVYFMVSLCSRASDYGLMKIDDTGRVVQFAEKPKGADLKAMVVNFTSVCCLMLIYLQTIKQKFRILKRLFMDCRSSWCTIAFI